MKNYLFSVSATGKENLLRIRAIMDAVAHRIAENTWYAAMSDEMLARVRTAIARYAGQNVSVVAHAVDGFSRKRLSVVFRVGTRESHYADGAWCIGSRRIIRPRASAAKNYADLVFHAGLAHDLGKDTVAFQEKLKSRKVASDRYRHELISVLKMMGLGVIEHINLFPPWIKNDKKNILGWGEYLVLTHHRLPGFCLGDKRIDLTLSKHVNRDAVPPSSLDPIDSLKAPERMESELTPVDFIEARAALMLADHFVSETRLGGKERGGLRAVVRSILARHEERGKALANPDSGEKNEKKGQKLSGHLEAVGRMARVVAKSLGSGNWMTGLSWLDGKRFSDKAGHSGRFAWQGAAVSLCREYVKTLPDGVPGLVIVGSSTGSGKTRGCMAIAGALAHDGLRATVAIGLRTLTLQTGDEYRRVFELTDDEMDVLIGSKAVAELHAASGRDEGADEGSLEAEPEAPEMANPYLGSSLKFPSFIETACGGVNGKRYLGVPMLVTTIDQVIKAANHSRSGWLLPWLRLLSSNVLILDEVDGYDLKSFPALLRFIEFVAIAGVHLIVSSATIYPALIFAIHRAWENGVAKRMARLKQLPERYPCVFVGDREGSTFVADSDIACAVTRFTDALTRDLPAKRLGRIIDVGNSKEEAFEAIKKGIIELHHNHAIETGFGNRLSVGLTRIAHIHNTVALARWLDKAIPTLGFDARIVLYHSENTPLARAYIEKRLDAMLKRSGNNLAPMNDPAVSDLVRSAAKDQRDACVIVIATPVEEVGRDHDFDWAVIEPSSARSIVQTSGRVLRHRDVTPEKPNVLVMQMNFSALSDKKKGPYFASPGFECGDVSYSKDVLKLIGEGDFPIDASMCLTPKGKSFGALDNDSIKYWVERNMSRWYETPYFMLAANHYLEYTLRETDCRSVFVVDFNEENFRNKRKADSFSVKIVNELLKNGLWNTTWWEIVDSYPTIDANDEAFREVRIYENRVNKVMISPLWGVVTNDGDAR